MPLPPSSYWFEAIRQTLQRYEEPLLRSVSKRLLKPRNQWPVDDLINRCVDTSDPTLLDRRLKELEPASRQVLALIGHSRQMLWNMGNLVEMVVALGHADGLKPLFDLLEAGLLYPRGGEGKVRSFEQWLAFANEGSLLLFAHPVAAGRAVGEPIPLAPLPDPVLVSGPSLEADGLDWPLRLAILWQMVIAAPLRRTLQGEFFKRDLDRLTQNALLNAPGSEGLPEVPDPGFLAVGLAELEELLRDNEGELRAGSLPELWDEGLPATLQSLLAQLFRLATWNALDGWRHGVPGGNPFPSAYLLALLVLSQLPAESWVRPHEVQDWLTERHPYWKSEDLRPSRQEYWTPAFLLGLAFQLRLVQAGRTSEGEWAVRLSRLGRWLLGVGEMPPGEPSFPKTLLVQPNLEILAYRQGLTPGLIARLTRLATWKTLGAACTLQLEPDSVYRALESGLTFESVLRLLEQHGTRATPSAVVDSLRTWANKRDRLTIYPAATLLEFTSPSDLNEALARGLPATRITDRLAVVASESAIDYSHFRLTGTRDYALPPERCVEVEDDGVTLKVDLTRADLMLETEISRFAEPVETSGNHTRRLYRLTPASVASAREAGVLLATLEQWFFQRTGNAMSPAAQLLFNGSQWPAPALKRHLVLHLSAEESADGLMQWPETRSLIAERLGPTTLSVAEDNADRLRQRLAQIGIHLAE